MPALANSILTVDFEADSPRVTRYLHAATNREILGRTPGCFPDNYLWIRHTHGFVGPPELTVGVEPGPERVVYHLDWERDARRVGFDLVYSLDQDTLLLDVANVRESGTQLEIIDFKCMAMASFTGDDTYMVTERGQQRFAEFQHGDRGFYDFVAGGTAELAACAWSNKPVRPAGCDFIQRFNPSDVITRYNALLFPVYQYRIRGEVQPLFHGRIGIVADRNNDGTVDWQDVCHWLRDQYDGVELNGLYRYPVVTKISPSRPVNEVTMSWKEAREFIEEFHARAQGTVPDGEPLAIIYLSGWQYDGHDTGYPSLDRINPLCGSEEELRDLITHARGLGVHVSVHVNHDDAYVSSPSWDAGNIVVDADGGMRIGGHWGGGQAFLQDPVKDYESGAVTGQIDAMCELMPLRDTIHIDVFGLVDATISNERDGLVNELEHLVLGKYRIVDYYNSKGLDVTTEGYGYAFQKHCSGFWSIDFSPNPDITVFLMHNKARFGGGGGGRRMDDPRSVVFNVMQRASGWSDNVDRTTSIQGFTDLYYLTNIPYAQTIDKPVQRIVDKGNRREIVFEDGAKIQCNRNTRSYAVRRTGNRTISRDYTLFAPMGGGRQIAYSLDGGEVTYPLPGGWKPDRPVRFTPVDQRVDAVEASARIEGRRIRLDLPAHMGIWVSQE